jgi:hypothetical protein
MRTADSQHGLGFCQLTKPTARKPSAVLQSVFYVMVFASNTPALLYFFQMNLLFLKMYLKKNKQVQPTPRSKKPRQKKLPEAK